MNKMMKIKYLLPMFLLFTLTVFAQDKEEKREQIKALKVSHITTELDLTSEQSAKFWPVYNDYEQKQYNIRHNKIRPLVKKLDGAAIDKMTDKEATNYLNQLQDAEEELFELRKKMMADLKAIIGPVKMLKLKKAEDSFNKKLLKKYKEKKK
jgi:Spy/CpxP family protein refolding chaperone